MTTTPPASNGPADNKPLIYTARDLAQNASRIIKKMNDTGQPAFITKHGRFVAVITALTPEVVESQIVAEMAHNISEQTAAFRSPPTTHNPYVPYAGQPFRNNSTREEARDGDNTRTAEWTNE